MTLSDYISYKLHTLKKELTSQYVYPSWLLSALLGVGIYTAFTGTPHRSLCAATGTVIVYFYLDYKRGDHIAYQRQKRNYSIRGLEKRRQDWKTGRQ